MRRRTGNQDGAEKRHCGAHGLHEVPADSAHTTGQALRGIAAPVRDATGGSRPRSRSCCACSPATGPQSFCHSLGDVPADALESVFEKPIQELVALVQRLRGLLVPGPGADQEIVSVIRDELGSV